MRKLLQGQTLTGRKLTTQEIEEMEAVAFELAAGDPWEYATRIQALLGCEPADADFERGDADSGDDDADFEQRDADYEQSDGADISLVTCPKCHGPASYIEKQTRAADEAMTQFCTCKHCHYSWRQ